MRVTALSLRDYRNYVYADVRYASGVTLILGSNGQGKTNLVESLFVLANGGSHRISGIGPLIRQGAESAFVRATFEHDGRVVQCDVHFHRQQATQAQINGNTAKWADVHKTVSVVMFAPEDISLVRGDPAGRRAFLDQLVCWVSPRLHGVLGDFERTLKQRNSLLKSLRSLRRSGPDLSTLDIWDRRLAELSADITVARSKILDLLTAPFAERYREVAGTPQRASASLVSSLLAEHPHNLPGEIPADDELTDLFLQILTDRREADIDRGQSTRGPHRDDILLELNGLPAKGFASHGESWSIALALRLAELDLKRAQSAVGDPIVILDDVFAELDSVRRRALTEILTGVEQIIITAAVADDVPAMSSLHTLHVDAGSVSGDTKE